jgi:hypothetical protein
MKPMRLPRSRKPSLTRRIGARIDRRGKPIVRALPGISAAAILVLLGQGRFATLGRLGLPELGATLLLLS